MNILGKLLIRLLLTLLITIAAGGGYSRAEETPFQASAITFGKVDDGFAITIKGNAIPTFTTYQLFDPLRVVVDIANANFADSLRLPVDVKQSPVLKITGTVLTDKQPALAKLEILLESDSQYTVTRNGNDICMVFTGTPKAQAESPVAAAPAAAPPAPKTANGKPEIYDLRIGKDGDNTTFLLVADGPIQNFSKVALPKGGGRPDRMYIDIPGVRGPALDREMPVGSGGVARVRVADRAEGVRLVFDSSLNTLFGYEVAPAPEGILVSTRAGGQAQPTAKMTPVVTPPADPVSQAIAKANKAPTSAPTKENSSPPKPTATSAPDEFADAGYDRQKISVDFYKTNLHNVFRLMGEVGGYNVVVDESVNGVLTLALREVPWDFLLDVIMNLKGLQKVERYNTLVISAKDKGFSFPERITPKRELEVETPKGEEAIAIEKRANQPPGLMEANMLIQRGDALAKAGKHKDALAQYQMALDKWPNNSELAKRMADMCLTDLGYNQAAVDYAKKALALDPKDTEAALQAAIALANMHSPEARQYFEKAASGKQPSRSALLSFSGYQEETADLSGALATLAKYTSLYNANLDSMIARARIFEKQGKPDLALAEYKAILYSGYELAPDLAQYIKGRIALDNTPQ